MAQSRVLMTGIPASKRFHIHLADIANTECQFTADIYVRMRQSGVLYFR